MPGRHGILGLSQPWLGLNPSPASPMTRNKALGPSRCIEHPQGLTRGTEQALLSKQYGPKGVPA